MSIRTAWRCRNLSISSASRAGRSLRYAIDADEHILPTGVTTVMAQGEAGAANVDRYRREVIEASKTRVFLALNLARRGEEYGGSCLADLNEANVEECAAAAARGVWGISVNTSVPGCGDSDPREVMRRALEARKRRRSRCSSGTRRAPDWSLEEQLPLLRAGDVVTYCFHGMPEGWSSMAGCGTASGRRRKRGVLFDLGHGAARSAFRLPRRACARVSCRIRSQRTCTGPHLGTQPPHSLPLVMSNLMAAGMTAEDVFDRVTICPSAQLDSYVSGHLLPGAAEDVCDLRPCGVESLTDLYGEVRAGLRWQAALTVCRGEIVYERAE